MVKKNGDGSYTIKLIHLIIIIFGIIIACTSLAWGINTQLIDAKSATLSEKINSNYGLIERIESKLDNIDLKLDRILEGD